MVTLANLEKLLDQCSVNRAPALGNSIPFAVNAPDGDLLVTVSAEAEGSLVQFRTVQMYLSKGQAHHCLLLTALMDACYRYKLVKFAVDPDDGEVVAYIDLFVGDGDLTLKQFKRCVRAIKTVVVPIRRRCRQIAANGVDPGPEEIVREGASQVLADMLAELRQAAEGSSQKPAPPSGNGPAKKAGNSDIGRLLDSLVDDD